MSENLYQTPGRSGKPFSLLYGSGGRGNKINTGVDLFRTLYRLYNDACNSANQEAVRLTGVHLHLQAAFFQVQFPFYFAQYFFAYAAAFVQLFQLLPFYRYQVYLQL